MAYQQSFNDDEENQQPGQNGSETVLSSESSAISSNPAASSAPTSAKKPKGSGYTNLSQYVDANKSQAAGMAEKVTGGINENLQNTQHMGQQYGQYIKESADQATVKDSGLVDTIKNNPQKLNEQVWKDYYKKQTQGYKGPQAAESGAQYQKIDSQYKNIDGQVKALDTNEGRYQAAQNAFSKTDQNYNRGENLLDSFLLGTGEGSNVLGQFQQQYKAQDPTTQWQGLIDQSNQHIGQARQATDATKQQTEGALQGSLGQYNKKFGDLSAYLSEDNAQNEQGFQTLQSQLASQDPQMQSAGFTQLGMDPAVGQWLLSQGYNPLQLASQVGARGLGDITNQNDIAGYEGLLSLTGAQNPYQFTKTGNQDAAFSANSPDVGAAKQAYGLESGIKGRLSEAQAARNRLYDDARAASTPTTLAQRSPEEIQHAASILGVTPEQYQTALDLGIISPNMVTKGADLNYGDVATDDERSQWANLLGELGISGIDLSKNQTPGDAFQFNSSALLGNSQLGSVIDREKAGIDERAASVAEAKRIADAVNNTPTLNQPVNIGKAGQLAIGSNYDGLILPNSAGTPSPDPGLVLDDRQKYLQYSPLGGLII